MTVIEALHVLGLSPHNPKPDPDDLKSAWRAATRAHHPDLHPDDAGAEERFKRVSEAYEILTGSRDPDPEPSSASSRPSVDLSGLFSAVLRRVAEPVHRATLVDLLGDDTATAVQAAARAFSAASSKGRK